MLKIAVCDDNQEDLSNIVSILNDYTAVKADHPTVTCTPFRSGVDLLSAMERGQTFELVFLDIIMPLTTGMDAANEIRQFNKEVKIVFVTSSSEYAVESYSVNAYSYILKPVAKTALYSILDRVMSEHEDKSETWFLVKSKMGLVRIYFSKLEYAEVIGRTIIYHIIDGSSLEAPGTMTGLEQLLLDKNGFIKPHRSYIINMAYIDTLNQRQVTMRSKAVVPVPKTNIRTIKSAYLSFAFSTVAE